MKGIDAYFEYMNEHTFMQRCYINGGRTVKGGGKRQRYHRAQYYLK